MRDVRDSKIEPRQGSEVGTRERRRVMKNFWKSGVEEDPKYVPPIQLESEVCVYGQHLSSGQFLYPRSSTCFLHHSFNFFLSISPFLLLSLHLSLHLSLSISLHLFPFITLPSSFSLCLSPSTLCFHHSLWSF